MFETPTRLLRTHTAGLTTRLLLAKEQSRYLFFQTLLGYEQHPRAVNLLIYSRRFLEFCQPRPQSALVLFTLLVVCSRLSRIFVPIRLPFRFVSLLFSFFSFFFLLLFLVSRSLLARSVLVRQRHHARVSLQFPSPFSFLLSILEKSPFFPVFAFLHRPRFDAIPPRSSDEERICIVSSHQRDWPAPRIYKIRHDRAIHSPRNYLFRGMYAADRI